MPEVSEDAQVQGPQPLDQRRRRQHLADAGAVNPHQRPGGPDIGAQAAALADPRRVFLAGFNRRLINAGDSGTIADDSFR